MGKQPGCNNYIVSIESSKVYQATKILYFQHMSYGTAARLQGSKELLIIYFQVVIIMTPWVRVQLL